MDGAPLVGPEVDVRADLCPDVVVLPGSSRE
jgi:hypothetical protein